MASISRCEGPAWPRRSPVRRRLAIEGQSFRDAEFDWSQRAKDLRHDGPRGRVFCTPTSALPKTLR